MRAWTSECYVAEAVSATQILVNAVQGEDEDRYATLLILSVSGHVTTTCAYRHLGARPGDVTTGLLNNALPDAANSRPLAAQLSVMNGGMCRFRQVLTTFHNKLMGFDLPYPIACAIRVPDVTGTVAIRNDLVNGELLGGCEERSGA